MKAASDVKLNLLVQKLLGIINGKISGITFRQVTGITIEPQETVLRRLEKSALYLLFSVGSNYGTYVGLVAPREANDKVMTVDLINNGSYNVAASEEVACAVSITNLRASENLSMRIISIF